MKNEPQSSSSSFIAFRTSIYSLQNILNYFQVRISWHKANWVPWNGQLQVALKFYLCLCGSFSNVGDKIGRHKHLSQMHFTAPCICNGLEADLNFYISRAIKL